LKTEKIRGLYKGITLNLIKGPVATGISFMAKNWVNRKID